MKIYKVGDTVVSKRSWTRITIAIVDKKNKMYVGVDGRAVAFEDVN